jgi:hypothetical protein
MLAVMSDVSNFSIIDYPCVASRGSARPGLVENFSPAMSIAAFPALSATKPACDRHTSECRQVVNASA